MVAAEVIENLEKPCDNLICHLSSIKSCNVVGSISGWPRNINLYTLNPTNEIFSISWACWKWNIIIQWCHGVHICGIFVTPELIRSFYISFIGDIKSGFVFTQSFITKIVVTKSRTWLIMIIEPYYLIKFFILNFKYSHYSTLIAELNFQKYMHL